MSINDGIDPRFLYHVEDESLQFRVGESAHKSRELETVGDRRFANSGTQQNFGGSRIEKDETRYSDGDDDEDDICVRTHSIDPGKNRSSVAAETNRESKNPGSVGWELVVRGDEEEKSPIDRREMDLKVVVSTNPDGKMSNSHQNKQAKRDFASVGKERVATTSISSWESLKSILSDPVTGSLMNDATILPCGHSFGAGGLKEVKRMKACLTCSQPTVEGSEKPNLSLRIVVHAFRQEEESDHIHPLKRRKDKSDQQKRTFCVPNMTETPKSSSRGIQFPFSIGDRIIIEGNKRTPPRFVGRKAVIMTQCLNGWYVVKTVDNAESIKLQHCSLAKISDNSPAEEQATSLAVEAATVASQWLEFLHQDLTGRLSAVQDSRNRVQSVLTTEIPHLVSARESSSDQESSMNTSGVASSDKTVTDTHQIRWSAKFDQINKALYDEERDLEHSLNQVKEMQSRCNEGLRQMDEYSPFSSQSSDSSFGKDGNQETSMAVQAAAASIFSTCSFLLSMMKPSPTGS